MVMGCGDNSVMTLHEKKNLLRSNTMTNAIQVGGVVASIVIGIVVLAIARPRSPDTFEGFETMAVADGMYTLYAKDG